MAILNFQKPDKVIQIEANDKVGIFEFRPLEPGYGVTIGNAMRRILLSSLEGFAITSVRFDNVHHEFSTIDGVVEDVVDIVLNMKQIRLKRQIEELNNEHINAVFHGQEVVTAGDLNKFLSGFQVLNPDLVVCHLDPSIKLSFELNIEKGRGYIPAEELKSSTENIGTIAMDGIFTPIQNVKYNVENYRVEQKTDYEKLIFTIETDGSIHPKEALKEAATILIQHFMLFSDEKIAIDIPEKVVSEDFDEDYIHMRQMLKTKLTDLDLSVRALNCLKAADVETLGQLVSYNKNDLLKFRNFGKKSLAELEELVKSKNLHFGMNISKYKLDKE
ncbi:MAG: DNA-directed RNA polymerase subunit alpha [Bacteroidales bacterium]|nr:DNA-directed RNA polymerase subunit alpha [Bacteroidales bacterium]